MVADFYLGKGSAMLLLLHLLCEELINAIVHSVYTATVQMY